MLPLLARLAWRNIFRNTRRTLLAGLAIGIGLAAMVFVDALMIGMNDSMIRSATDTFLGQGQIHADGFRATSELERTIRNPQQLVDDLRTEEAIAGYAPRTRFFAMVSSPSNVAAVVVYGIDPALESGVSRIDEAVTDGAYLEAAARGRILLGSRLADLLDVSVGDRLVFTAARAETGELVQEMFRVGGVFRFGVRSLDESVAFIPLAQSQKLLGLEDQLHEIALRFARIGMASDESLPLWERWRHLHGNEALGWRALLPELDAALSLSQFSMYSVGVILFGVVALSIMNTLVMSLYERTFEFGVLRAVGTRPLAMATMIVLEAGALAIVSIAIGSIIGLVVTSWVGVHGIDYVGIEFGGVTFREAIFPVLEMRQFVVFSTWVLVFALVAGVYPAVLAARLRPAEALQRSL